MSPGTEIGLKCEDGYHFENTDLENADIHDESPSAICTKTGDFSIKSSGVCEPGCSREGLEQFLETNNGENLRVPVIQLKTSFKVGERTRVSCSSGYSIRGNSEVICTKNNDTNSKFPKWEFRSSYPFKCLRNCDYPPSLLNTYQDPFTMRSIYSFDDTIYYSCHKGFSMRKICENCDLNDNEGKMTCHWDGTWSETNFECLPGCGVPPSFRNGKMLGFINKKPPGYFEVGSELTYRMFFWIDRLSGLKLPFQSIFGSFGVVLGRFWPFSCQ